MIFHIHEVDGADYAADIAMLHETIFDGKESIAPPVDTLDGHWWLAWHEKEPVAYAGLLQSDLDDATGYYKMVGVLPLYRGHGLQLRLTRAIEARCRRNGWRRIVSDTTDAVHSANNFIRAGYRLWLPAVPWAFENSLYWTKRLS